MVLIKRIPSKGRLSNRWRSAKRELTSAKEWRGQRKVKKVQPGMLVGKLVIKAKHRGRDEAAKGKFASETLFGIVVAVVYFVPRADVLVMALLFRKLCYQMPERIQRLEQYCEQYCRSANESCYERMCFHLAMCGKRFSKTAKN